MGKRFSKTRLVVSFSVLMIAENGLKFGSDESPEREDHECVRRKVERRRQPYIAIGRQHSHSS